VKIFLYTAGGLLGKTRGFAHGGDVENVFYILPATYSSEAI